MSAPRKKAPGRWKPGESGNPTGRRPGTGEVAAIRAAIADRVPELVAALSGKLRLCKSATTRAESAALKKALQSGARPWDTDPALDKYFS